MEEQQLSTSLPFDLLIEILCRLPVKLLSQLRCVCKSFNTLISSDSKFAKKHLRFSTTLHRIASQSNDGDSDQLVLFDTPIPSDLSTSSTTITQSQLNYPSSLKVGFGFPLCVSSCDGILCFTMIQGSAVLWNPSIRKSKILSSLIDNTWSFNMLSVYSFGYDNFIHSYKIVATSLFKDKTQVYVHTLGTTTDGDDWRRIQDFPYLSSRRPGIFVSGTVNWLMVECVSTSRSRIIVSLDLKKEMYRKLSQPDSDNDDGWTLGVSRDCLCIFAKGDRFLDVWIMKEYGSKESWTKLYRVPHMDHQGLYSFKNALYISKNDQLLMDVFELDEWGGYTEIELVVYHSKTGTLKIADFQDTLHWIDPLVYIESLISPCS